MRFCWRRVGTANFLLCLINHHAIQTRFFSISAILWNGWPTWHFSAFTPYETTLCVHWVGWWSAGKVWVWNHVNNQLDAQFLRIYFTSLHVSSDPVLIIRRINCINTAGMCVGDRLVWRSGRNFPAWILDGHLQRVTHTRCCIDTIDSPDDEHEVARNM
jgi:hypothetical protein